MPNNLRMPAVILSDIHMHAHLRTQYLENSSL